MTTATTGAMRRAHREAVHAVKLAYPAGHPKRLELLRQCDAIALKIGAAERASKK